MMNSIDKAVFNTSDNFIRDVLKKRNIVIEGGELKKKEPTLTNNIPSGSGWLEEGPATLPIYKGGDTTAFLKNLRLYFNEKTFHPHNTKRQTFGNLKLSNRPDIQQLIKKHLAKSQGVRSGITWKTNFEGPLKSLLWKYFQNDEMVTKLWLNLDNIHELTDKSDKQENEERSLGQWGTAIAGAGATALTGNPMFAGAGLSAVVQDRNVAQEATGIPQFQTTQQQQTQNPQQKAAQLENNLLATIDRNTMFLIVGSLVALIILVLIVPLIKK